jgi:uncharacterized protein
VEYRNLLEMGADMEIRSTDGGAGRTLAGIAVPWGRAMRIRQDLTEEFVSGAFDRQLKAPNRIKLYRNHSDHPSAALIGRLVEMRNDAKGLYVEARVSPTMTGDETLALLADEVLDQWSIGFREIENKRTHQGVVQRVKAQLFELAIVPEGAYGAHAKVASMRSTDVRPNLDAARAVLERVPILPPLPSARV